MTVLRVGVYENPPKLFLDPSGQIGGILGELLQAMAEQESWTLQPVRCVWQTCLDLLAKGQLDLLPDVARTPERVALFAFHRTPALQSWSQLYQRRGGGVHGVPELEGRRIAVVKGSVQAEFLRTLLAGFAVKATPQDYDSFEQAMEAVGHGEVDAVALNRFTGLQQAPRYGLEPTGVIFQPSQIFYAAPPGRPSALLDRIDARLNDWQAQENSPYQRIVGRWMQSPASNPWPQRASMMLLVVGAVALLALGMSAWLRQQVRRQTASLRASENRLNTILDSVDALIYIKDTDLRYQYVNQPMGALLGQRPEALLGRRDDDWFAPETVETLRASDQQVLEHGRRLQSQDSWRIRGQDAVRTFLSVKLPLRDTQGKIIALCGIATDITERFAAEEAIHQLAFFDALTGLPNRRLLQDRVKQQLAGLARHGGTAALMFIDVDNFKDINDTLGHDQGDVLLQQMAQRMLACLRAQDTLARQGGDEFVMMLVDLDAQPALAAHQAQNIASKLLEQLHQPFDLGGQKTLTSVSIGVTLMDASTDDVQTPFKQADLAMYQAKSAGRNAVRFFNPRMQAEVIARTTLGADLRWALAEHEFVLHYQPQVDNQGKLCGLEALLRWAHPLRGLIQPADFIPTAEDCGLIVPLGQWVLRQACLDVARWQQAHPDHTISVAVNVSARQFRQTDFAEQVRAALTDSGAQPEQLELELTESQLLDNVDAVVAQMHTLKALGVRLSLDDFGTGYSSLARLKHLPLDQLKIDQHFVRDMLFDAQDAAIIRAIVVLGESLGLAVIAEGVEKRAQRDALVALGCRQFQGFYYGAPVALTDLPAEIGRATIAAGVGA
ncbi:MAG: hypothetical protein Fur007_16290 [Rhodoferax sp.]